MKRARTGRTRRGRGEFECASAAVGRVRPLRMCLVAAALSCSVGLASARAEAPAAKPSASKDPARDAARKPVVASAQPQAAPRPSEGARACFQRAQAAYAIGDLRSALAGFLCAFQAAPSPELHYNLARVYERMGDAEESTRHYRAYMAQAEVTPKERKRIEARLQALQDLSERQRPPLEPTAPSATAMSSEARSFYERGVKLFRVKQYSAALAAFSAALQMSNAPELHFNLAVVAERMNRAQEAVDHYRAYLAVRSDARDRERIEERIAMLQTIGP
jgi:tetratricopeptide (TPR) repeat protein